MFLESAQTVLFLETRQKVINRFQRLIDDHSPTLRLTLDAEAKPDLILFCPDRSLRPAERAAIDLLVDGYEAPVFELATEAEARNTLRWRDAHIWLPKLERGKFASRRNDLESPHRAALAAMPGNVLLVSANGRALRLTSAGNRHLELIETLLPAGEAAMLRQVMRKVLRFNRARLIEFSIDSAIGTTWHEAHCAPLEFDGKPHVIWISNDISSRKSTERMLEEAHNETEKLVSAISMIMIGIGGKDRITRWNPAAEEAFGIKARDIVGAPFLRCGIEWNWVQLMDHIAACRDADETTLLPEIEYKRPDGRNGFLNLTMSPLHGDRPGEQGYLLLGVDVTERKSLQSQLSHAQKLESIGQLAAGIAHEINTPIQFVGDNLHFLQESFVDISRVLAEYAQAEDANSDMAPPAVSGSSLSALRQEVDLDFLMDEIPEAVKLALKGTRRVADIVRAMKDFSHPGTGEKELLDINHALENTITVAKNEWKYVADIVRDFDAEMPRVPCLPGELNQVFLNMIVNAAHAIQDVLKEGEKGSITVSTRNRGDQVEIAFADSGSGIPEKVRSKIFDPFFTTKEVGKGTGQGLAISHNVVVDKHGGELSFETEIGKGTTFYVKLPLAQE